MNVCNQVTMLHQNIYLTLKKISSCFNYYCDKINFKIQGLSELADQNNTVNSSSSGNNRKNVQKNPS
jgi:hypothetical protein